ncbi:hypothetical protein LWI29_015990 [Acer saccharum]|uniref:Uncharacterized protein n=1 Tax=Acer saccharum TaxID=4024 RepID=A0AA39T7H8_ACESA|nr:hypothetical protein LWI29_015990 [Acer saccharum]
MNSKKDEMIVEDSGSAKRAGSEDEAFGRNGGGNQFGSGTAGKSVGVPTDSIQGKANKDVNPDVVKKANTSKVGGSRFEIFSEEMDVTMNENIGQPKMSSDGGSKINEQGILAEITNQTEKHAEESIMISHTFHNKDELLDHRVKIDHDDNDDDDVDDEDDEDTDDDDDDDDSYNYSFGPSDLTDSFFYNEEEG